MKERRRVAINLPAGVLKATSRGSCRPMDKEDDEVKEGGGGVFDPGGESLEFADGGEQHTTASVGRWTVGGLWLFSLLVRPGRHCPFTR